MTAHPDSPNWGWQQIGYTIERYGRGGRLRRIIDQEGGVVLDNSGHEGECAWLRERGIIEREPELF
ncbi:MAG TPA: hypothetical protein VJ654_14645 [Noviherbaspirillum sp.]|nr:hypothetical protein [Noviherbaspirillum sp.]